MSTAETEKIFEPMPKSLLEAFLQKFRLFTTNKEPDELMTTTQLFDVFDTAPLAFCCGTPKNDSLKFDRYEN
jgi:hypothetical protein